MGIFHHETQTDLDPDYYARRKAYNEARREEAVRIAKMKGVEAARRRANKKPFYQKVTGAMEWLAKDVSSGQGGDPFGLFSESKPKPRRRKAKRRRRR